MEARKPIRPVPFHAGEYPTIRLGRREAQALWQGVERQQRLVSGAKELLVANSGINSAGICMAIGANGRELGDAFRACKVSFGELGTHALVSKLPEAIFRQILVLAPDPARRIPIERIARQAGYKNVREFGRVLELLGIIWVYGKRRKTPMHPEHAFFGILKELKIPDFPGHDAFLVFFRIKNPDFKKTIIKHLSAAVQLRAENRKEQAKAELKRVGVLLHNAIEREKKSQC